MKHLKASTSNIKNIRSIGDIFKLLWTQTKPLFVGPNLMNMIVLSLLSFFGWGVAQAFDVW